MSQTIENLYHSFIDTNHLRDTKPRKIIFTTFYKQNSHMTAEELYQIVHKVDPKISQGTVYRNLRLFCNSGYANEIPNNGFSSFEASWDKHHHDHLICLSCGKHIEFHDKILEDIQLRIALQKNFKLEYHNHILYGKCKDCQ